VFGFTLSVCHPEPDASSNNTISPTEYPAALDTWTEFELCAASAVRATVLPDALLPLILISSDWLLPGI
jgi:hypothetical protein